MAEKDLVQEALQQMKNLEDVVQENAKGILGATMAQEISELVKESLVKEAKKENKEQEEDDELDVDMMDVEDTEEMGDDETFDMEDSDEMLDLSPEMEDDEMGTEDMEDDEMDFDMEPTDLTMLGDDEEGTAELLKIFKSMKDGDGIEVVQNDDQIHFKDDSEDVEYIIQMESEEDMYEGDYMEGEYMEDMDDVENALDDVFSEEDDIVYEITLDEEDMDEEDMDEEMYEMYGGNKGDESDSEKDYETTEGYGGNKGDRSKTRRDYEQKFGGNKGDKSKTHSGLDYMEGEMYEEDMEDEMYEEDMEDENIYEANYTIKPVRGKMKNNGETKENQTIKRASNLKKHETKEGNYMSKPTKPTAQKKVEAYKTEELPSKGISNVKKSETKEGKTIAPTSKSKGVGMNLKPKKFEYKEASRTYGNGSKEGRGLRKGITPNRNYVYEAENKQLKGEIESLSSKNEEYRKALNIFREKLNEVAVFNSNLAYATRLFTEHTTTKQEKINILRRFDDVETLKESKNLYSSIKNELSDKSTAVVTESIEKKIDKTASTGSATNLIESKTYENPQFMRMKDLMNKLK
jgi:hypothetical protein